MKLRECITSMLVVSVLCLTSLGGCLIENYHHLEAVKHGYEVRATRGKEFGLSWESVPPKEEEEEKEP